MKSIGILLVWGTLAFLTFEVVFRPGTLLAMYVRATEERRPDPMPPHPAPVRPHPTPDEPEAKKDDKEGAEADREWSSSRDDAVSLLGRLREADDRLMQRIRANLDEADEFFKTVPERDPDKQHWISVRSYDGIDRSKLESAEQFMKQADALRGQAFPKIQATNAWATGLLQNAQDADRRLDRVEQHIRSVKKGGG